MVFLPGDDRKRLAGEREFASVESLRDQHVVEHKNQIALRRVNDRRTIGDDLFDFRIIERACPDASATEKKMTTVGQKARITTLHAIVALVLDRHRLRLAALR